MNRGVRAVFMTGLLGLPAALVLLLWAEPAQWLMTERGLVMTQELTRGQFDVVAKFSIIGLVAGFIAGSAIAFTVKPITWRLVPLAIGGSLLAAGLCWLVARVFGPSDPTSVTGIPVGELVPTQFTIDAWPAFLAWPLGALLIVASAVYMSEYSPDEANDLESEQ
ncbi:MAG: hypothetical protein GX678_01230 [Actinomycetales bacterium]|nr:hypothetical protein [Actinomycetales bacterium]